MTEYTECDEIEQILNFYGLVTKRVRDDEKYCIIKFYNPVELEKQKEMLKKIGNKQLEMIAKNLESTVTLNKKENKLSFDVIKLADRTRVTVLLPTKDNGLYTVIFNRSVPKDYVTILGSTDDYNIFRKFMAWLK